MCGNAQALYEQTLVIRSQIGDEAAFQELLALYGPHLLRFARKMMQSSPDTVQDIAQEIWLAIYRGLPSLQDAAKFRPWAFRIARDRIYREYRRRKIAWQPLDDTALGEAPIDDRADPVVDIEELGRCLDSISPEQREALVLRFFEDMSYEEIASVTACAVGTVRSRIHYAKRAMKNALERNKT